MQRKRLVCIILIILLFSQFIPHISLHAASDWWNQDWNYRQELLLPIDTSDSYTHFLPIDLHLEFENPCWAKDTGEHSLRVIMHLQDNTQELELQIYELIYSDTTHLQACNIIFLIPDTANGKESYYLYYHDDETPKPEYPDHLQIEESYYFYEPITGFPFESSFYKIVQDEEITYAVAYDGKFMGTGTTHQVTKMKSNVNDVKPQNGELFASFDFMYYYGNTMEDFSSTIDHFLSKEIKIDGNLMIEFGITSTSTKKDIQTTAIYTYYYCPTDHKRIYATITHEALKPLRVASGSNVDGTYASLQVGGIKSTAIQDLNFGKINPYLHIYTEKDTIQQFPLDPDPEFIPDDWDIRVISTKDDIDLGNQAWASFDDGETGNAHALILEKTDIVTGKDEEPGIQVKAHEQDYPHLPGLESDMAFFQFGRNSYETGTSHDLQIPEDFQSEFNAEFYTTHTGGYPLIDKEATIYHQLLTVRPTRGKNVSTKIPDQDTFSLTTYIHAAPAIPLGSILTAATGRNFPYISAELYKADNLLSSGIFRRVQFNPLPNLENKSTLQKIRLILGIIDWKNLSFSKKITFQNLPADNYVLKVFRTNNLIGKTQRYIGVKTINLTKDTTTRIIPRPESKLTISITDQNNQPVSNAEVIITTQNQPIYISKTDDTGTTTLTAPQSLKNIYTLNINYNGFNIHTQPIKLRRRGILLPLTKHLQIQRHEFQFNVLDTWNLPPEVDIHPVLIGTSEETKITQPAVSTSPGYYTLQNLTPNDYTLRLQYSTFTLEELVTIPSEEITIAFPAEFQIKLRIIDDYGNKIDGKDFDITRKDKRQNQDNIKSEVLLSLPPGNYKLEIKEDSSTISTRTITVLGDRSFDLITLQNPWYLNLAILITIFILVAGTILFFIKRRITLFTQLISISLITLAIVTPWWTLSGSSSDLTSNTKFILLPTELITITQTSTIIAGELASLPEIIDLVVLLLLASTIAGIVFLSLAMFIKNKNSLKCFISFLLAFLAFLATIGIYLMAMAELSAATVGSLFGSGSIDTSIPGQAMNAVVASNWGPGIGFYLYLIATIIIGFTLLQHTRTMTLFTSEGKKDRRKLRKKLINYFKKIIPLTGIILLIYIIYDIGIEKITDTFLQISPIYLLIAAALTFPRLFIRNTQWQYLLKSQRIIVSYWTSMKIFLISYFYGAITPGYLGLMIRIPYMKAATNQPFGKLFINSMVETAVHGLSLYIMMLLGALAVADQYPEIFYGASIFVVANIIIYAFFIKKERGEKTFYFFIKIMVPKIFKKHLTQFVDTFYEDFPNIREFLVPFLLGIPAWIIIYSQIYIISIPLGIEIPYFTFLVIYAIGNIIALIPITTAGLGTREAALIFLFGLYGMAPEKAVVISLAGHLLTDVLTGIYGFIISLTEARNIEYKEEIKEFLTQD
jgi:uncharacterized protein (TIRG00374 family)